MMKKLWPIRFRLRTLLGAVFLISIVTCAAIGTRPRPEVPIVEVEEHYFYEGKEQVHDADLFLTEQHANSALPVTMAHEVENGVIQVVTERSSECRVAVFRGRGVCTSYVLALQYDLNHRGCEIQRCFYGSFDGGWPFNAWESRGTVPIRYDEDDLFAGPIHLDEWLGGHDQHDFAIDLHMERAALQR